MNDRITTFYEEWHHSAGTNRAQQIRDRDIMALDYLRDCDSVFELGCGAGTVLNMCGASYKAGADISRKAIDLAIDSAPISDKPDLKVVDIDKEEIPWETETFDGVMVIEVLEHLFDPVHALAEMNKILKKNGKIVVTVPNIGYFPYRWYHFKSGEMTDFHGNGMILNEHIRFYGVKTLRMLLEVTGFEVVNVKGARKKVIHSLSSDKSDRKVKGSLFARIMRGLTPTPTNVLSRCNVLFSLWKRFPSFFAMGIVVEAIKIEDSKYKYNQAIDHQVRTSEEDEINVNALK